MTQANVSPTVWQAAQDLALACNAPAFSVALTAYLGWLIHQGEEGDLVVGLCGPSFGLQPEPDMMRAIIVPAHQKWTARTLISWIGQALGHATSARSCHTVFSVIDAERSDPTEVSAGQEIVTASSGCDIDLTLITHPNGVSTRLQHAADLFIDASAQLHSEQLMLLLEGLCHTPDLDIRQLSIQGPREQALLQAWNATDRAFDRHTNLPELFARQARLTPNSIAITHYPDRKLSYKELDARSNQVAHALRSRGIGRGALVGMCIERGLDLIVAQHGIMKAGAAYVPLDPTFPGERLNGMAQDAQLALLVAQQSTATWGWPLEHTLLIDVHAKALQAQPITALPANAQLDAQAEDPAYVIYTSGSTGKPKGVCVPHRSVVNLLSSMTREPGLRESDRWLTGTTLSFDMSIPEVMLPLTLGAEIVLVDRSHMLDGEALRAALEASAATVMEATPSSWRMLIEAGWQGSPTFKALIGGEALPPDLAAQLLARTGELWNMYGPTETTVWSTGGQVPPGDRPIHIGRPLDNTQVHILDEQLRPCPIGARGEICIGGDGVTLGYLQRPELTADRFVPDPFRQVPGALLYRTGDSGRWCADGVLEHHGRLDFQVKVRGYRIELGEIEAALTTHTQVARCVVIVREDRPGDQRLVAYIVPNGALPGLHEVRTHLGQALPDYMLPQHVVGLQEIPLSPNGKVNRRALPAPTPGAGLTTSARSERSTHTSVQDIVCDVFKEVLGLEHVEASDNFFDLGGTSLLVNTAVLALRKRGLSQVNVAAFFGEPTPAGIATQIQGGNDADQTVTARRTDAHEPIAIIGMAGRFPGASDMASFWDNLIQGRDTITHFTVDELDPSLPPELVRDRDYVRARGVIDGIDQFDPGFFGINPKDAEIIDPQQRVFLEISWECLERAGYAPGGAHNDIGVYAGVYSPSYLLKHVWPHQEIVSRQGELPIMFANDKDYVSTRVAHRLNLKGPAIAIHTACSTSLVAVATAVDALRAGRCHMALAGGASVTCPPRSGYLHEEGAMLSSDGKTRTFDAAGQGTVFSDGAAVVLLKRLSEALADGDHIHAVIRGAATNNDGSEKASFTAPSIEGQTAVILAAHADAGITADSIGYIEAHGTATPLGDPIEVEALTRVFRRSTHETGFCQLGSVKTNVGHLITAAGATGLMKAALSLEHEQIPPSLHFDTPNPKMDLTQSPFVVASRLTPWPRQAQPRRAGISSFGVGGTNAHVVIEEAPSRSPTPAPTGPCVLRISARTAAEAETSANRLAEHLRQHPDLNLLDVAHTLKFGRKAFAHRVTVVAQQAAEAAQSLAQRLPARVARGEAPAKRHRLVFVFPGQGAQYAGMGRGLYDSEAAFRQAYDQCLQAVADMPGFADLKDRIFHGGDDALRATATTQPATFCLEYALAHLWLSRGLTPDLLIGHSVGEFVAAVIAGVMPLSKAIRLVAIRGGLMQAQPSGAMLSVRLPASRVEPMLPADLDLAADNSPQTCVVAGPHDAIARFQASLEQQGVVARALQTSHAFHSSMMESVVGPFEQEVRKLHLQAPTLPIVSTLTGQLLSAEQAQDSAYWAHHLRAPVRFSPAVLTALSEPHSVFLEIGPRNTLATLIRQHRTGASATPLAVSSLTDTPQDEQLAFTQARAQLWTLGLDAADAADQAPVPARRVPLPTYPFNRRRCWLDPMPPASTPQTVQAGQPATPHLPQEIQMPTPATQAAHAVDRRAQLLPRVRSLLEDVSGLDMDGADPELSFVEQGLDSLTMTQVAGQIKRDFKVDLTFRTLMEKLRNINGLVAYLDEVLPPEPAAASPANLASPVPVPPATQPTQPAWPSGIPPVAALPASAVPTDALSSLIQQQIHLMSQQLAMLGQQPVVQAPVPTQAIDNVCAPVPPAVEDDVTAHTKYDVKKAFGAIARITTQASGELTERQKSRLSQLVTRYTDKTRGSKAYTQDNRDALADPRVVNGFRPQTKEITYQIVVNRSKGSRMWDIDGNEYVDALSGFGMSLFGWQPDFVLDAVRKQLDAGYEIGPQHPLAGEVARLMCELTGHDRAGLCNTGSEAVMGTVRIARTVTGRTLIATFSNSYHGIFDEVIIRGNKKHRAVPAAPGIMSNSVENVIVLDYGAPESLQILRERGHEIAAVLVEPVQSRRPDLQPTAFLKEVRNITRDTGALLIFDEVITGFRSHIGGAQALFGIKADLASYGKVIGGGFPIGVIAGKREYMDALDGGGWQFGDDSIPTVGVTYFAGTFVRHPLALAAAKASLEHLKEQGPALQERLNSRTQALADELNAFCRQVGAPVEIKSFSSLWRMTFTEDHPLQDLLHTMMRLRGVHLLDNFPCYMTTAHTDEDFALIKKAFKESIEEMQESDFLPRRVDPTKHLIDANKPPVAGARLGRDPQGRPAWYAPHPAEPGKFMKVE